jgi:hypothetical protein
MSNIDPETQSYDDRMKRPLLNRPLAAAACVALVLIPAGINQGAGQDGILNDDELREDGYDPLFNGQSLEDWSVHPWHEGHWTGRGGIIDYDGKASHKEHDKNSLWTKQEFTDTRLYAEWRLPARPGMKRQPIVLFNGDFLLNDNGRRTTRPALDAGDSGIMFRGTSKCQANIWCQDLGSGEINGYRTDRKMPPEVRRACIPIKKADRPMGEWNAFLITLNGDRLTVELNGERVIEAARLPGLPESGPIGLQHHGDRVQFRRIWVKKLN